MPRPGFAAFGIVVLVVSEPVANALRHGGTRSLDMTARPEEIEAAVTTAARNGRALTNYTRTTEPEASADSWSITSLA
ncbi:hypothetical protein [Streptomyces sp. NPDC127033]|uniref:hypothetical protein n=1 Tax=Streptomyces sp. NPDC127033 TaxID=3347110 RepID=UPI0036504788